MFRLRIVLKSPLCSGSGLSRPGAVDREVVFDDCGLPWLPGRRLKGLLKDAWSEVRSTLYDPLSHLPTPERLFGEIGRECPGDLRVQNAYLPGYNELREWAVPYTSGDSGGSRRAAIMDSYSAIRRQTSIDRNTGAPKRDTLRATRTLRPGLIFEAPISCAEADQGQLWAIALAAPALRQMGSSRWRGLGRVECELVWNGASGKVFNWTKIALEGLSPDLFKPEAPSTEESKSLQDGELPPIDKTVLAYELALQEPAVFPIIAGDPNTVNTAGFVPGSAIHGWFARGHGDFESDEFRRLFTSGTVRFLNANPAIGKTRACPLPHSIRRKKESDTQYVDLTTTTHVKEVTREGGWCDVASLAEGNLKRPKPETSIHYHHERAEGNLFQRALGPEEARENGIAADKAGAFFQYEALLPGQRFMGEIRGPAADLARIRALAPNGEFLELGRSRSAQYGGRAKISWKPAQTVQELNVRSGADTGPSLESARPDTPSATSVPESQGISRFLLIARSAVLGYDLCGMPSPCFPLKELQDELNRSPGEPRFVLKVKEEFARVTWEGGYLGHLRMPRPQQPAWAAGSVLVLEVTKPTGDPDIVEDFDFSESSGGPKGLAVSGDAGLSELPEVPEPEKSAKDEGHKLTASELARAATRSYGLRREQGYGEIVLLPQPAPAAISGLPMEKGAAVTSAESMPARELALNLFGDSARRQTRYTANEMAQEAQGTLPTPALLHRLLALLRAQDEGDFRSSISGLRDRARRQIESCRLIYRLEREPKKVNLAEMLELPRRPLGDTLTHRVWLRRPWGAVFRERPALRTDLAAVFLEELLAALAKESRRRTA